MNNKEVDDLAIEIYYCEEFNGYKDDANRIAHKLTQRGYGHIPTAINYYCHSNVKAAAMIDSIVDIERRKAVKEFIQRLKSYTRLSTDGIHYRESVDIRAIDELFTKLYGDGDD